MEPTVDLVINSATGEHQIELVFDGERRGLAPAHAAKLAADIATVLSFVMHSKDKPALEVVPDIEEPALGEDAEDVVPRITWHRTAVGTSRYKAQLGNGNDATIQPAPGGSKGWDIKINNKKVNKDGPVIRKRDAVALVERIVTDNKIPV
jgi:hypothetical protein